MEKVFKILVVFALLMLIIVYSARIREKKFREYYFDRKIAGDAAPETAGPGIDDLENQLHFHRGDEGSILVSDLSTGSIVSQIPVEEHVDTLAFDPLTRLIYSCSGEGAVTIIRQTGRDRYKIMQRLLIPKGYPIVRVDPQTGKIFLYAAERADYGSADPADGSESFADGSVLVYTQE